MCPPKLHVNTTYSDPLNDQYGPFIERDARICLENSWNTMFTISKLGLINCGVTFSHNGNDCEVDLKVFFGEDHREHGSEDLGKGIALVWSEELRPLKIHECRKDEQQRPYLSSDAGSPSAKSCLGEMQKYFLVEVSLGRVDQEDKAWTKMVQLERTLSLHLVAYGAEENDEYLVTDILGGATIMLGYHGQPGGRQSELKLLRKYMVDLVKTKKEEFPILSILSRSKRFFVILMNEGDCVMTSSFMALSKSLNDIQNRIDRMVTKGDLVVVIIAVFITGSIAVFLIMDRMQNLASMIQDIR